MEIGNMVVVNLGPTGKGVVLADSLATLSISITGAAAIIGLAGIIGIRFRPTVPLM